MKIIFSLFLLIFSAYALTNNNTIRDIMSLRFQHFYDEETDSYNFSNMNNDRSDYVWEEVNEEGVISSVVEWPLEEDHRSQILDDSSEIDLHNVLSQILKDSSYNTQIGSFLENNLNFIQNKSQMPFKTNEGYIDLFDLLIFGSLRSRRYPRNAFIEEESNEEGIFQFIAHNNAELTTMEEEDFDSDDDEDDMDFIELLTSDKRFSGEYIIEMVLSMMKKHSNDVDDDEEEENLFDEKEEKLAESISQIGQETDDIFKDTKENLLKHQDITHMRPTENREGAELDQVFASVFDF